MLTTVDAHPVTEGAFVDTELLSHAGDWTRRLDHHLHGLIPEFRGEAPLQSGQLLHLSRRPILLDGLSGMFGAPQLDEPRSFGGEFAAYFDRFEQVLDAVLE